MNFGEIWRIAVYEGQELIRFWWWSDSLTLGLDLGLGLQLPWLRFALCECCCWRFELYWFLWWCNTCECFIFTCSELL